MNTNEEITQNFKSIYFEKMNFNLNNSRAADSRQIIEQEKWVNNSTSKFNYFSKTFL